MPIEETIEALQHVVEQGKARYLGFSEWTPEQIQAALAIAGPDVFVSSQPQYSMLWRAPEAEVFPLSAQNGISQILWSPLAQGLLSGKYRPGQPPPEGSRFADPGLGLAENRLGGDDVLEAVQRLHPVAADLGLELPQLALAWVLRRSEVASAITGASRPGQIESNVGASDTQLDEDALQRIDAALGPVPVLGQQLGIFATEGVLHR